MHEANYILVIINECLLGIDIENRITVLVNLVKDLVNDIKDAFLALYKTDDK